MAIESTAVYRWNEPGRSCSGHSGSTGRKWNGKTTNRSQQCERICALRSRGSTRRVDGGRRNPDRHSCQGAYGGNSSLGGGKAAAAAGGSPAATRPAESWQIHCKKKVGDFPVHSRDVTNQTLPGLELLNYSRPGRVWLVTSRLGTGESPTFLQCTRVGTTTVGVAILIGDPDVRRYSLQHGWMLKKSCFRSSRSFFKISLIVYISFLCFITI